MHYFEVLKFAEKSVERYTRIEANCMDSTKEAMYENLPDRYPRSRFSYSIKQPVADSNRMVIMLQGSETQFLLLDSVLYSESGDAEDRLIFKEK